ncbi:uncharacterized protein BXZ73DRAFT_49935, partial [Epithele typhae]|uniref:uncharacterized protein n=1 Tax=Epithele typhae TaxID=378194 RepID=UPI002007DAF8
KRDSEIWFEDGTLVLVVEDTSFRVYKGLLTLHSPVFRDMFSFPPPSSDNISSHTPLMDGDPMHCAVVHLPDSVRDWRYVLRFLFNCGDKLSRESWDIGIEELLAYARLGHKYQIESMLRRGISSLKFDLYPFFIPLPELEDCRSHIDPIYGPGIVNLARLVEEPSLLPPAMLLCSRTVNPGYTGVLVYSDGQREHLNAADEARCVRAGQGLLLATISAFNAVISTPMRCSRRQLLRTSPCQKRMDEYISMQCRGGEQPTLMSMLEPLMWGILRDPGMEALEKSLCTSCWKEIRIRVKQQRRVVWNQLPRIFEVGDVPNWEIQWDKVSLRPGRLIPLRPTQHPNLLVEHRVRWIACCVLDDVTRLCPYGRLSTCCAGAS